MKIVATPVYTVAMLEQRPIQGSWVDSVALDRSVRVHIHGSTLVELSAEWTARRLEREKEAEAWLRSAMARAAQGQSPATIEQLLALRESRVNGPRFEEGAPELRVSATLSEAKACRP